MTTLPTVAHLPDHELVARLRELARSSHELTAHLLVHLAEVEDRKLHLEAACDSMFAYTTRVLGFDEAAAYKRIHAARIGKRFPRALELLALGRLHLAGIGLLGPHLTEENHEALLEDAAGKSKRDIEVMLAARAPKPDVPAQIRKLPGPKATLPGESTPSQTALAFAPQAAKVAESLMAPPKATAAECLAQRPTATPLAADRFKVQFTASAPLADKLEQTRALLAHREPGCDLGRVIEIAVDRLHAELLKQRFGVGAKSRRADRKSKRNRHVPKETRREVIARDGLSCAYVDPESGRRCGSRDRLELQHHQPFARGGAHEAQNLSVYCHAHNAFAARRDYGPEHIDAKIRAQRWAPLGSGIRI